MKNGGNSPRVLCSLLRYTEGRVLVPIPQVCFRQSRSPKNFRGGASRTDWMSAGIRMLRTFG